MCFSISPVRFSYLTGKKSEGWINVFRSTLAGKGVSYGLAQVIESPRLGLSSTRDKPQHCSQMSRVLRRHTSRLTVAFFGRLSGGPFVKSMVLGVRWHGRIAASAAQSAAKPAVIGRPALAPASGSGSDPSTALPAPRPGPARTNNRPSQ